MGPPSSENVRKRALPPDLGDSPSCAVCKVEFVPCVHHLSVSIHIHAHIYTDADTCNTHMHTHMHPYIHGCP